MKMKISAIFFVKESLKTNIVKIKIVVMIQVIKRCAAHSICNSK